MKMPFTRQRYTDSRTWLRINSEWTSGKKRSLGMCDRRKLEGAVRTDALSNAVITSRHICEPCDQISQWGVGRGCFKQMHVILPVPTSGTVKQNRLDYFWLICIFCFVLGIFESRFQWVQLHPSFQSLARRSRSLLFLVDERRPLLFLLLIA